MSRTTVTCRCGATSTPKKWAGAGWSKWITRDGNGSRTVTYTCLRCLVANLEAAKALNAAEEAKAVAGDRPAAAPTHEASVDELKALLREAEVKLMNHHAAHLVTWRGYCPVCTDNHTQWFPNDILSRIERALGRPSGGKTL